MTVTEEWQPHRIRRGPGLKLTKLKKFKVCRFSLLASTGVQKLCAKKVYIGMGEICLAQSDEESATT